jgi:hypothetical protein
MNVTDSEANPEEIEAVAKHQEVPNEEASVRLSEHGRVVLGASDRP